MLSPEYTTHRRPLNCESRRRKSGPLRSSERKGGIVDVRLFCLRRLRWGGHGVARSGVSEGDRQCSGVCRRRDDERLRGLTTALLWEVCASTEE